MKRDHSGGAHGRQCLSVCSPTVHGPQQIPARAQYVTADSRAGGRDGFLRQWRTATSAPTADARWVPPRAATLRSIQPSAPVIKLISARGRWSGATCACFVAALAEEAGSSGARELGGSEARKLGGQHKTDARPIASRQLPPAEEPEARGRRMKRGPVRPSEARGGTVRGRHAREWGRAWRPDRRSAHYDRAVASSCAARGGRDQHGPNTHARRLPATRCARALFRALCLWAHGSRVAGAGHSAQRMRHRAQRPRGGTPRPQAAGCGLHCLQAGPAWEEGSTLRCRRTPNSSCGRDPKEERWVGIECIGG